MDAFLELLRNAATAISIFLTFFLVGCDGRASTPIISPSPATRTPQPSATIVISSRAPIALPTETPRVIPSPSDDWDDILRRAVVNLQEATSFELSAHEVRAYRITGVGGDTELVYGEFNSNLAVIRSPALKVNGSYEYRYDPQAEFFKYSIYAYQENEKFYTRLVEDLVVGDAEEIDPGRLEPFAGDVYQTLVNYHDQADFVGEQDGTVVYRLEHPEWYRLQRAIGFANLGFLSMQENGDRLIEQYVSEHYPDVKTVSFTIVVNGKEGTITKVGVDDRDFMYSIWAAVEKALIEQGTEVDTLPTYQVTDANGAEYFFHNYNQVQAFEIPTMQPLEIQNSG